MRKRNKCNLSLGTLFDKASRKNGSLSCDSFSILNLFLNKIDANLHNRTSVITVKVWLSAALFLKNERHRIIDDTCKLMQTSREVSARTRNYFSDELEDICSACAMMLFTLFS